MYTGQRMKKARRIKVPNGVDLLNHFRLKSHWDWYWKNQHKVETDKKIKIDIDEKITE